MSVVNLAFRQCLLELLHARICDLRTHRFKPLKSGQPLEASNPGVCDLCVIGEGSRYSKLAQLLEISQPSVRYTRAAEVQFLEFRQSFEALQPHTRDLRLAEAQLLPNRSNPSRCFSPTPSTRVPPRFNSSSWVNPFRYAKPVIRDRRATKIQPLDSCQSFKAKLNQRPRSASS